MIKVGDQVIITKVTQVDKRDGMKADTVCIVTGCGITMCNIQPIDNPSKEWIVFYDQVRKF